MKLRVPSHISHTCRVECLRVAPPPAGADREHCHHRKSCWAVLLCVIRSLGDDPLVFASPSVSNKTLCVRGIQRIFTDGKYKGKFQKNVENFKG